MSRSKELAEDFLLLAVVAGLVGGLLAYTWLGVHAPAASLVPKSADASSLAPALAVAEAGVGALGTLWNLFVTAVGFVVTALAVAFTGLLTFRLRRE